MPLTMTRRDSELKQLAYERAARGVLEEDRKNRHEIAARNGSGVHLT